MESKETKKTIRTFAFASFLNDLGSDMIFPIWPIFVTTVLGANMMILGLIDGLGDSIVSISQAISGYISDKIRKRKIFVWTGYLLASVARIGYALSLSWQTLIPCKVLDRFGKIRGAPRDAIIADISTKENRGKNFGLMRTMDHLGAFCGIVICILLFGLLKYRNLFLLAAIPSIIGTILIFFLIKEKQTNIKIYKGFSLKNIDKNFKLFFLSSSFFALGSFSYSFLLIYAKKIGFKITFIPILYLIFTFIAFVFSLPFGKISDKIGRKKVLILSYILWGLVCLVCIYTKSYLSVILIFILYGLHKGALEPVQKTFISELSPIEYRASSLGSLQMIIGLCVLPSSLIAGILWDKINIFMPFCFSLSLTILSIIILMFVDEKNH